MTDAPERIGLVSNGIGGFALWNSADNRFEYAIEYTRTDLVQSMIAAAVAEERERINGNLVAWAKEYERLRARCNS